MYAEKLYFLYCFLHVFSAYFGTIWQNKIGFSNDIQKKKSKSIRNIEKKYQKQIEKAEKTLIGIEDVWEETD